MGQLLIPDVPDETIARFKQKAEINGRTLEAELRDLIERKRRHTRRSEVTSLLRHTFHD
jgi:plasmid stability protein